MAYIFAVSSIFFKSTVTSIYTLDRPPSSCLGTGPTGCSKISKFSPKFCTKSWKLEVQSLKSQQTTEADILQEILDDYYSEENFIRILKDNKES